MLPLRQPVAPRSICTVKLSAGHCVYSVSSGPPTKYSQLQALVRLTTVRLSVCLWLWRSSEFGAQLGEEVHDFGVVLVLRHVGRVLCHILEGGPNLRILQ